MSRDEPADDFIDEENNDARTQSGSLGSTRMVDWFRAFTMPVAILIGGFCLLLIVASFVQREWVGYLLMALIPISALANAYSEFSGYKFNAENLEYPFYVMRRSLLLSELRGVMCETTTTRKKSDFGRIIGETKTVTSVTKTYKAHLSGEFGVRTLSFGSLKKREQFLSLLRLYAPNARIRRRHY